MIYTIPVNGIFQTNCYFLIDENTKHGFLIDPGAQGEKLLRLIRDKQWVIEKILLTHGHFDHFGGAFAIKEALNIPVMIHSSGYRLLSDPQYNLSGVCNVPMTIQDAEYFEHGDTISLISNTDVSLQVLYTPGHTVDSCVFYYERENVAFVGDTIFKNGYGEYRYPTGNYAELMKSIREKILRLPSKTVLLSGHSAPTTVNAEKRHYRM